MKKNKVAREWKAFLSNWQLTVMVLPTIILLFIFNYIPFFGFLLPFKNYKFSLGFLNSSWAGLKNFKFLFSGPDVMRATINTVGYNVIFLITGMVAAIAFAIMLNELTARFIKVYQTIFFLPYFVSWVVASFAFMCFLDVDYGIFNKLLEGMGMETVRWYAETKYWPIILIFGNLWKTVGYNTIIFFTELMSIDKTYYEAAVVDGATKWQQIRLITLPCLKRIVVFLLIMSIGKLFSGDFGMFYNLPRNSSLLYPATDVLDTYVYRALTDYGNIGMSSAAAFYQSVVGFFLVIISNTVIKKLDEENALF